MSIETLQEANDLNNKITALQTHWQAWAAATEVKELRFVSNLKLHITNTDFIDFDSLKTNTLQGITKQLDILETAFNKL